MGRCGPSTVFHSVLGNDARRLDQSLLVELAIERQHFASAFATEDRAIGMTSFLENGPGKASFVGR